MHCDNLQNAFDAAVAAAVPSVVVVAAAVDYN